MGFAKTGDALVGLPQGTPEVCRRIERRCRELGLPNVADYRAFLETHPEEWSVLDSPCRISISRFYRDRGVFGSLRRKILPSLAELAGGGDRELRVWSAGCASGEEDFRGQDIRAAQPPEMFHLIMYRNLVLTRVTRINLLGHLDQRIVLTDIYFTIIGR
jgi:hypothetical protein